jgi:superoxide reductase
MTCCGATMEKLEPKTADAATEKHVPVCEKVSGGYKVKVGSVPHPMESEHWIQWIEVTAGSKVYREYLKPGQDPEAVFPLDSAPDSAREYCNKHGLWKG